jgi:tetratricopeptide (TPR) repeat protein
MIHTELLNTPELQFSPAYLNYGMIVAPAGIVHSIGAGGYADLDAAEGSAPPIFKGQIALTLSIARNRIRWAPLSLRYNFPNIPEFFEKHPDASDIRAFHYGQPFEIDKARDFQTYGHVEMMLQRENLGPVNRRLAECFRKVHFGRVVQDLGAVGMLPIRKPHVDVWVLQRARDRARTHVDRCEFTEAYRILSSIIGDLPQDAHANYLMAYVVQSLGNDDATALRHYERALESGFDEFWVRYHRGALHLRNGRLDLAAADIRKAASLRPDHPGVHTLLARFGR